MALVIFATIMAIIMKGTFNVTNVMAMAVFGTKMGIITKALGKMIFRMARGCSLKVRRIDCGGLK